MRFGHAIVPSPGPDVPGSFYCVLTPKGVLSAWWADDSRTATEPLWHRPRVDPDDAMKDNCEFLEGVSCNYYVPWGSMADASIDHPDRKLTVDDLWPYLDDVALREVVRMTEMARGDNERSNA